MRPEIIFLMYNLLNGTSFTTQISLGATVLEEIDEIQLCS